MGFDIFDTDNTTIYSGIPLGASMSTVGVISTDAVSADMGSGGLGANSETSSMASGESTTEGAPLVGNVTTAPSAAGGPLAGTIVVGGTAGTTGSMLSAAPETSSVDLIGHGNVNGVPFRIWEDSSGGINIEHNTVPYSRVEKRAQQTYDALHKNAGKTYTFPAVVMESKESLDAFCQVFGENPSPGKMEEKLAIIEKVLMEYEKNH